ncbi:MAG TPA: S1/P1 nuclease [Candidatus Binatia bacterium]|nr:S1/P1 nuclease [Candidatus Binatia bacterium]
MPTSLAPLTATFLATFFASSLLTLTSAFSWYDKGHRIVGLIAQANLVADARNEIQKILPGSLTLADAAVWPDHEGRSIRDFDPLHYVSIPENASGYDQARDCPDRNCMVEALKWFLAVVADKNASIIMRRFALHYVAHLVGDMHQPLHAGRAKDRGGVDILVSYRGQTTNLHFFWDTNLVELETGSEEEIAKRLTANLTEEERLKWQAGDPKQWTNESLILARSHAYKTGPSVELSDDYVEKARPIVRSRLAQAGIRLAWLLNTALK